MSLINDALKRAEQEKQQLAGLAIEPGFEPPDDRAPRRKLPSRTVVLIAAAAVVAAVAGWLLLRGKSTPAPAEGSAIVSPQPPPPAPRPVAATPPAKAPQTTSQSAKTEVAATPPASAVPASAQATTTPAPPAKPQAAPQPLVDVSKYVVTGIMYSELDAAAIVNGQFIRPGDEIDSAIVVEIRPLYVEFKSGEATFRVAMY